MDRPGHLGIKDPKTFYSLGASPEGQRPGQENAHTFHGRTGAPSLHVRACKAGGELTLGTYQVAWVGRTILASTNTCTCTGTCMCITIVKRSNF